MIRFGTGGFRGIIAEDFNKQNVQLVIQALCNLAKRAGSTRPVIVGYDYRFASDYAADWVAEVLAGNGMICWRYDEPMPTPAVMSVVRDEKLDYGVMITASHNPYNYNGVKLFLKGGVDADVEFTGLLERECASLRSVSAMALQNAYEQGLAVNVNFKRRYFDNIKAFISDKIKNNHAKILYNDLCGVGTVGLKPLAQEYGIKQFDVINDNHDAFFGGVLPNPTKEMMLGMRNRVIEGGYDFAIATDSDSDRLGVLDEKGNYVDSNDILACLYYYLVRHRGMKGDVVKNCATSILLDRLAERLGYRCHEVDVGFKNISSKMLETNALIGGESSGGLTVRGYVMGKDSVFSASLFMEMVICMGKSVSQIVREVHEFAGYDYRIAEVTLEFDEIESVKKQLNVAAPDFKRELRGVKAFNSNYKYYFDDNCWVLVRMSGTEPVVRVFAEMTSQRDTDGQISAVKKFLSA